MRRLVLNDVGPAIRFEAVERIGSYLGHAPRFASVAEGAAYLRTLSLGFGPHSDADWLALSEPMLRADADADADGDGDGKGWRVHYDPAIALPFGAVTREIAAAGEAALWAAWDRLSCPTLLIRGADSDLLSADTARQMTERGPRARLVELPGIGHAPTLVQRDQIALVRDFLSA